MSSYPMYVLDDDNRFLPVEPIFPDPDDADHAWALAAGRRGAFDRPSRLRALADRCRRACVALAERRAAAPAEDEKLAYDGRIAAARSRHVRLSAAARAAAVGVRRRAAGPAALGLIPAGLAGALASSFAGHDA